MSAVLVNVTDEQILLLKSARSGPARSRCPECPVYRKALRSGVLRSLFSPCFSFLFLPIEQRFIYDELTVEAFLLTGLHPYRIISKLRGLSPNVVYSVLWIVFLVSFDVSYTMIVVVSRGE